MYDREQVDQIIEKTVQAAIAAARRADDDHREAMYALIEKHEHLLYGNGKEGIVTKLDRIERAVAGAQKVGDQVVTVLVVTGVLGVLVLLVEKGFIRP